MKLFNKKVKETNQAVTPVDPNKRDFTAGLVTTKDIIAPSSVEVDFNNVRIDSKYYRTLFVASYPRFVGVNWLSSLINFDASLNISMYVYPTDGKEVLDDLRRKITEMEAEISTDVQRGRLINPATQAKLEDALNLQANLVKGEERFFQFGLYITISGESPAELDRLNKNLEAALGSLLIISKKATLQMEEGFITTLPIGNDKLNITRNMDTTSLATTFPFVSSDLSDDKGIMYGINIHNGSLVIFDRFSMPNYNSVVFATAGAGKSYLIKLEALRSLMMGTEIIVIDPENEYRELCESVGGQYIAFGYGEDSKINPFDLTLAEEEGENGLNTKMLSLHKLFKVMLGQLDPLEESLLDRALVDAYKMKGITPDPTTQNREPPLIEDLYKSLIGMEDEKAKNIAARLEKYIRGSFAGIFNQKTTVNLTNKFVVFGIKNLEDVLRPVAMQIILDYVWTVVKKTLKKRILIVDEAWYLMQYEDSASFLRGIVKRGRKYYLGVTTITQDVDDFLATPYGKEIVTNSSIQILLKQHSAAIDQIGEVFYLSQGEKQLLLSAGKGEGIFFAGQNHVAIKVIASDEEHALITSNPQDILNQKKSFENKTPPQNPTVIPETKTEEIKEEIETPEVKLPEIKPVTLNIPENKPVEVNIPTFQNQSKPTMPAVESPFDLKIDSNIPENKPVEVNIPFNKPEEIKPVIQTNNSQTFEIKTPDFKPIETNIPINKPEVVIENKAPEAKINFQNQSVNKPMVSSNKNESVLFSKPEVVILDNKPQSPQIKPIFINTEEKKIPQPPQFSQKPQPVFEPKPLSPTVVAPSFGLNQNPSVTTPPLDPLSPKATDGQSEKETLKPEIKKTDDGKMDYDKLFGDGIV